MFVVKDRKKDEDFFQKGDILQAVSPKEGLLLPSEKSCIIPYDSIMKVVEDASNSYVTVKDANGNLCKTSVDGLVKGYNSNSRVKFFSNKQSLCSTLSIVFMTLSLILFISALALFLIVDNHAWAMILIVFGIIIATTGVSLPTPFALNTYNEYKVLTENAEKDDIDE